MILNMTITGTSSTKSIMIISIDSGSTVAVYSDAACTTLVKNAIEKSSGEFWVTDLINREYYIKATRNNDERIIPYTITEYGVYRISMSYSSIPAFTYINDGINGGYEIVQDDDTTITDPASWRGNWKIRFLTSGTLNFSQLNGAENGIDLFLVGGGGGAGGNTNTTIAAGGGGGYTGSYGGIAVSTGIDYPIVVGAGGTGVLALGNDGGSSSAFGYNKEGGKGGAAVSSSSQSSHSKGGDGGSGGAGSYWQKQFVGGSDGGDGTAQAAAQKGLGQGTSTREFYTLDQDITAKLYAGGGANRANSNYGTAGAGGGGANSNGEDNLGGGAGGGNCYSGGSGIVIIRNARS